MNRNSYMIFLSKYKQISTGLEISFGYQTMTDRIKCLTELKLFQSEVSQSMSSRLQRDIQNSVKHRRRCVL